MLSLAVPPRGRTRGAKLAGIGGPERVPRQHRIRRGAHGKHIDHFVQPTAKPRKRLSGPTHPNTYSRSIRSSAKASEMLVGSSTGWP